MQLMLQEPKLDEFLVRFRHKGFSSYSQSAPASTHSFGYDMAFRMICKTLTTRSLAAVSRAAPTHCTPSCSLLRHAAAASVNRPPWRNDTNSLISLRNFNTATVARSALTDILQEEIVHEKETYQPPEVSVHGPAVQCMRLPCWAERSLCSRRSLADLLKAGNSPKLQEILT